MRMRCVTSDTPMFVAQQAAPPPMLHHKQRDTIKL